MQKIRSIVLVLMVSVCLFLSPAPAIAQGSAPASPAGTGAAYLILLTPPTLHNITASKPLDRVAASAYLAQQTERAAQPLLETLNLLQQQGILDQIDLLPEQNAISVQLLQPDHAADIAALPGVQQFAPASSIHACAQKSAQALPALAAAVSASRTSAQRQNMQADLATTDPSIEIYAPAELDYGVIIGQTTPNIPVQMSIQRSGKEIHQAGTTSDVDGSYIFYPFWMACRDDNWGLLPGDVIQVTAHGKTVKTALVYLSGWVDQDTNTVSGKTKPYQKVRIELTVDMMECNPTMLTQEVKADGSGAFSWHLSSKNDLNGTSYALLYALDANGNSTLADYYATQLITRTGSSDVQVYLHPLRSFSAAHQRGTKVLETITGVTNALGFYPVSFAEGLLPGDVASANDGLSTLATTYTAFSATLDAASHKISGTSAANHIVQALIDRLGVNVCSIALGCGSAATDSQGKFAIPYLADLFPGDTAQFEVFDSAGNLQNAGVSYVPNTHVNLDNGTIAGIWPVSGADLTFTYKDNSGSDLGTQTVTTASLGAFNTYFIGSIAPGDQIEVTDGTTTRTYIIPAVSATLNNDTDRMSGSILADGDISIDYISSRGGLGYGNESCHELTAADGQYSLDLSNEGGIGGGDWATITLSGKGDSIYSLTRHALTLGATINSDLISGYATAPSTPVTANLLSSSGQMLAAEETTARKDGSFDLHFNKSVLAGMKVQLMTGGLTANLSVPALTVAINSSTNSIYGKAPANQPVVAELYLPTHGGQMWVPMTATAGADGSYNASYNEFSLFTCNLFRVDAPCASARVSYYQPDGQSVSLNGPPPKNVDPDVYEANGGDNTYTTAVSYTGLSSHTFDNTDDEDWIAVTIDPGQVGQRLALSTVNIGPAMYTSMVLYDTDGQTVLDANDEHGVQYGSMIYWTPSVTGTYFVRITPYYRIGNTSVCGSYYDFGVFNSFYYLPEIGR